MLSITNRSTACPRADRIHTLMAAGRAIALAGVVLPMLLIGLLKFTQVQVEALKPLIHGTPWLRWMYVVFGEVGASHFLGVVELLTAALLVASRWSAKAAVAGGLLGIVTFVTTLSIMFALPIWNDLAGGFPWLNRLGTFLLKDIALLGISLVVFAQGLGHLHARPTK